VVKTSRLDEWLPLPWSMAKRLVLPLTLAALLIVACGIVYWHIEPTTPTLADGVWLAFVTAATIGYGDVVPTSAAARAFTPFVLLLGFGVLSLVTAAVAATWVEARERQIEREILHDLHRQMGSLHREMEALRKAIEAERGQR
jgi:voltage-gated potassium channel